MILLILKLWLNITIISSQQDVIFTHHDVFIDMFKRN